MAKSKQTLESSPEVVEPSSVAVSDEGDRNGLDSAGVRLSRHLIRVQGGAYLPAAARIAYFNEMYPGWRLVTTLIHADWENRVFSVRAEIYDESGNLVRTGHAMETAKRVSDPLEKAETSAVARALGYLNIGTFSALEESERLSDAPLEPSSRAPVVPMRSSPVIQHPALVRLAKELSVSVRPEDTNEMILTKIHDAVVLRDSKGRPQWGVDLLRAMLKRREVILKLVADYKQGIRWTAEQAQSALVSQSEGDHDS